MQYLPFTELKKQKALIVDSLHPYGTMLSHWRGAPTPAGFRDDTSAAMVLNALKLQPELAELEFVSANHFDIDAFVGIWCALHPKQALANEQLFRQMAKIGDFRELNRAEPEADEALKLVCWINALETKLFYPPFGTDQLEENEVEASPPKFRYFLEQFGAVLADPERARQVWEPEYRQVLIDQQKMNAGTTSIRRYPEIGLVVLQVPEPLHYYALFGATAGFDIVLCLYSGNRYELEYKYTTWVDIHSRPTLPRLPLAPLAEKLQQLEGPGPNWSAGPVTDTGPLLRLDEKPLPKSLRYANPTERPFLASAIEPAELEDLVAGYFREGYKGIRPKRNWSWKEIKALATHQQETSGQALF